MLKPGVFVVTPDELNLVPFNQLISFKIGQVANALSRHGELVYQEAVGLRLDEARMLGAVLTWQPIALKDLSQALSLSKSQCSRLVANMVGLGLLDRHDDPLDQRSFYLSVTDRGLAVLKTVNELASERNRQLCELLSADEAEALSQALDKLLFQVGRMQEERLSQGAGAGRGKLPETAMQSAVGSALHSAEAARALLVDRQKALDLLGELQKLLGAA